ncbi:TrkH family potassium uptake protein [Peribacillus tepidiphilus]|uniref:TrkH family potassium uptake protein n=1 Tax=Peribacillus tepidiphilus TaxID=2652445 RepID=UPI001292A34C|nr:TrkH family potassium uptake protein [Peribacillus tepidiphilus]
MMNQWKEIMNTLTPARIIVIYYFLAVTLSTILLKMPVALKPGVELPWLDALFIAVSAVSVTGLTVIDVSQTFSIPGIFILMFVLQLGGIGIMTLGTFLWLIFGKKIGFKERRLIMMDQNQPTFSGLVDLLRQILIIIFVIELSGAIILGTYFLKYFPTWQEAFLHGLFSSVSATTNGGFDITGASLKPYANDYFIQFIHMILIILGAIGFPVLIEVKRFIFDKAKMNHFRFSLFTKLTTLTFLFLIVGGTIAILILERQHFFSDKEWHQSFFYALFQSVSTRSGGLATMNVDEFTSPTLLLLSALMFIGASPSSVGGGIRTTTFALNLLFLYHFAKGTNSIKIFKREIHDEDIHKSLAVSMMGIFICFSAVMILSLTENFTLLEIIFEVCSAFGTTGLSMGITSELSSFGKWVIIVLMFIGRVGIISFLFMIGGKEKRVNYNYPKERIIIG